MLHIFVYCVVTTVSKHIMEKISAVHTILLTVYLFTGQKYQRPLLG